MPEVPVLNRRASKSASGKELISIGKSVAKRTKNRLQLFFVAATRARERHKHNLIEVVKAAADKDARHAEWLLERQFPHEFAPYARRPIPVEGDDGKPKQFDVAIVCNTGGKSLEQLLDFPVAPGAEAKLQPTKDAKPVVGFGGRVIGWENEQGNNDEIDES